MTCECVGDGGPLIDEASAETSVPASLDWTRASRPLRILEVCNEFPPTLGGSETHNAGEVDFLCRRGHDVCVLVARDWEARRRQRPLDDALRRLRRTPFWRWSPHGVPVYETEDRNRRSTWSLARQYFTLSRRHGPFDVVVAHRAHYLPSLAAARRLVLTLHYMELACPTHYSPALCSMKPVGRCTCYRRRSTWRNVTWWARRRLSVWLMDAVVTKYRTIQEKLIASGIPASKVKHVPNWIDASVFGGRWRAWSGMPAGFADWARCASLVFVALGRLHPYHGPVLALEAFAQIAARNPGARLVFIGDGPEAEGMRARIAEARLESRVWMLGGVPREDIPAALSWADCALATSAVDNYTWRLLEVMAAGLPVIATTAGDTAYVVREGVTGYLCDCTPEAVAAAMDRLAREWPFARSFGEAARKRIILDFSPANLLNYEAILYGDERAGYI